MAAVKVATVSATAPAGEGLLASSNSSQAPPCVRPALAFPVISREFSTLCVQALGPGHIIGGGGLLGEEVEVGPTSQPHLKGEGERRIAGGKG